MTSLTGSSIYHLILMIFQGIPTSIVATCKCLEWLKMLIFIRFYLSWLSYWSSHLLEGCILTAGPQCQSPRWLYRTLNAQQMLLHMLQQSLTYVDWTFRLSRKVAALLEVLEAKLLSRRCLIDVMAVFLCFKSVEVQNIQSVCRCWICN